MEFLNFVEFLIPYPLFSDSAFPHNFEENF